MKKEGKEEERGRRNGEEMSVGRKGRMKERREERKKRGKEEEKK